MSGEREFHKSSVGSNATLADNEGANAFLFMNNFSLDDGEMIFVAAKKRRSASDSLSLMQEEGHCDFSPRM